MLKDFLFRGSLQLLNFSKYTIIWSQIELLEYILKSETQIVTRLNVIKLFLTWSENLDKELFSLKYFLTCILSARHSSNSRSEKVSCYNRNCAKLFSNNWLWVVFNILPTPATELFLQGTWKIIYLLWGTFCISGDAKNSNGPSLC